MKRLLYGAVLIAILFTSCKKEDVEPVDNSLTPEMGRDSLYYIMKEFYLWYNLMPQVTEVTKANYKDPYELLDAMRYRQLDRWSFVADYDEFLDEMNGTFVGHGFRIGLDAQGLARIALIYNNAPLYTNGVRRGWIVKTINNKDVAAILKSGDSQAYSEMIGPAQAGITNIFVFRKPDGTETTISSTKSTFTLNTVLVYDTLHLSNGITGHLVFDSFINPSAGELATAFAFFKSVQIKDLILDLRYNTGGYLNIAQNLASYIAGDSKQGAVFAKLQYNDKHPEANSTFPFRTITSSIGLSRLAVITSRSTASASEAVINGLKPFVDVVTIGDTTDGKPTGMNGWDIGKKYYMWPVTFKMVNSQNQGEYFDGIYPAKLVSDDITRDFTDRNELCLREAIHYMQTGSVSSKRSVTFSRQPQFSERPGWMNNAFLKNE